MNQISRRAFVKTGAGLAFMLPAILTGAADPFQRPHPRISGLGLTTFSLRPHMRFWHGRPTAGKMDILDFLEYSAKLELDAAELTSYFFPPQVERAYTHEIRRRAHLLGLNLAAGAIGNNFSHPPGSEQAGAQLTYTRTWIDHFAEMGIPVIRIFAGNPPSGVSVEEAMEHVVIHLEEALDYAGRRGVMLGIENHNILRDVNRLLQILGKVESKWLGVTFDSGNLVPTPDPYGDLERIAPYAVSAQLKVMIPVNGRHEPADFERVIDILLQGRYSGPLILEYEEAEDPLTAVPRYIGQLRRILAGK
jgi:sugar phosphate isomerase/epimerase